MFAKVAWNRSGGFGFVGSVFREGDDQVSKVRWEIKGGQRADKGWWWPD
jgi:hypothetical protein